MPNRNVVHVEIPAVDFEQSGKFYQQLFGWKVTHIPEAHYSVWEAAEGSRGGFPLAGEDATVGDVRIYIGSDDIEADLKKARSLGAEVVQEKKEIPGRGWYGIFKDPAGNTIGLFTRTINS